MNSKTEVLLFNESLKIVGKANGLDGQVYLLRPSLFANPDNEELALEGLTRLKIGESKSTASRLRSYSSLGPELLRLTYSPNRLYTEQKILEEFLARGAIQKKDHREHFESFDTELAIQIFNKHTRRALKRIKESLEKSLGRSLRYKEVAFALCKAFLAKNLTVTLRTEKMSLEQAVQKCVKAGAQSQLTKLMSARGFDMSVANGVAKVSVNLDKVNKDVRILLAATESSYGKGFHTLEFLV